MARWHDALLRRRRTWPGDSPAKPRPVLVVLCSEPSAAVAFVSACDPALVWQTFGGARHVSAESTRTMFLSTRSSEKGFATSLFAAMRDVER